MVGTEGDGAEGLCREIFLQRLSVVVHVHHGVDEVTVNFVPTHLKVLYAHSVNWFELKKESRKKIDIYLAMLDENASIFFYDF